MRLIDMMEEGALKGASDIHFAAGNFTQVRINGNLVALNDYVLTKTDIKTLVSHLLSSEKQLKLDDIGQVDFSYRLPEKHVFRINIYKYSDTYGLACRIISDHIPTIDSLELPEVYKLISDYQSGLVLFTGPTGCGKSTSIAAVIDSINKAHQKHILTIEDPIEYVHKSEKCIITQREVGRDCRNFSEALVAGLRQDPDVILVGEMRDLETISTAITAAETGHLVLATLHTRNAAQTIERIIDVFPNQQQQQIRVQLANSLMAVFSQRLLPRCDALGRVAAIESLVVTPAVRNLIRENKVHQLQTFIQTGQRVGMQTFDDYLKVLYKNSTIDKDTLIMYAADREAVKRSII
jgi:twitching motility protein PilT